MIRWEGYFFQSPNCLPLVWKLPSAETNSEFILPENQFWMQDDEMFLSLLNGYLAYFQEAFAKKVSPPGNFMNSYHPTIHGKETEHHRLKKEAKTC